MYYRAMNAKTTQPDSTAVAEGYRHCEKIAGRGIPNLYLAARFFEQPALFDAFCATYASMRVIDDHIDSIANREKLSPEDKEQAMSAIGDWLDKVNAAFALKPPDEPVWLALADTFSKFDLPMDPWEDLAAAMAMDIEMPYFKDWRTLQKYMRGASVAPAVVFMHHALGAWHYIPLPPREIELGIVQTVACGANPWFAVFDYALDHSYEAAMRPVKRIQGFLEAHEAYYTDTTSKARIALLVSSQTAHYYVSELAEIYREPGSGQEQDLVADVGDQLGPALGV